MPEAANLFAASVGPTINTDSIYMYIYVYIVHTNCININSVKENSFLLLVTLEFFSFA